MQKKLFVYMLFFCIYTTANAQYHKATIEDSVLSKLWEEEFEKYAKIIEQRFGMTFDAAWKPKVDFSFHKKMRNIKKQNKYKTEGRYGEKNQSIEIMVPSSITKEEKFRLSHVINHELSHALIDQYENKVGKNPTGKSKKVLIATHSVLFEGLAEYLAFVTTNVITTPSVHSLPRRKYESTMGTDWYYQGGYWIVKPIIDTFGVRGIDYIIKNSFFSTKNWNMREGAIQYQKRAFEALRKE